MRTSRRTAATRGVESQRARAGDLCDDATLPRKLGENNTDAFGARTRAVAISAVPSKTVKLYVGHRTGTCRRISSISDCTEFILPLAIEVCTMPLQKILPSDNILFFAEMDGGLELGGATFGFFRSFDLRLQSGL